MNYEFHNPNDEETEEQIAYEREMYSRFFQRNRDDGQPEFDGPPDDGDRSFGSSGSSGGKSHSTGKSIGGAFKGLVSGVKNIKSFVSLDNRLSKELYDANIFPEVTRQAHVRKGLELCQDEKDYLAKRKVRARDHFARYMGWDPAHVHPDDVPTVAFGGSGGGYRAMLAVMGYTLAMKQQGLWPLLSYISGVSGSCWAIAAYYTFGHADIETVINHCKKRLSPHHPLSPDAISMLLSSKLGDYQTLGPLIQKQRSGLYTVPMDLYAVFTTGYLFMQTDPMIKPGGAAEAEIPGFHKAWWKWSDASPYLANGDEPLPILTAIRHERPWKDWADAEHPFANDDPTAKEHKDAQDAWFQWYEMTPYEIGCDELEAWCPTWGFGRRFEEGLSQQGLPEQSLALLLGLCTSAPAGPLSSYLSTIQRNLPSGFIGDSINKIASGVAKMWGKQETAVFENHHPLHASNEHNYVFHLTPTPKGTPRPAGIENSPKIHLIDSGMDNNCPTYVMLHPDRKVDVILNMDASSDVQKDSFQQRVSQIGFRRGLNFQKRRDIKPDPNTNNPDRFKGLYAQIYDGTLCPRPDKVTDSNGKDVTNPPAAVVTQECTMVYLPLLPNERAVPGYDPSTAKFSGSYNLVWTPEQVDMIIKTSVQNFIDGQDTIKEALFNAWQRKKWMRESGKGVGAPQPFEGIPQGDTQGAAQPHWIGTPQGFAAGHPHTGPYDGSGNVPGQPPLQQQQQQQNFPPPPPGPPPVTATGYPQEKQQGYFPPPPPGPPPGGFSQGGDYPPPPPGPPPSGPPPGGWQQFSDSKTQQPESQYSSPPPEYQSLPPHQSQGGSYQSQPPQEQGGYQAYHPPESSAQGGHQTYPGQGQDYQGNNQSTYQQHQDQQGGGSHGYQAYQPPEDRV